MKNFTTFLLLFCTLSVFAQKEANFWYFGQNAGLNFNSGTPVPIVGSLNTLEGCSSFSDKDGNLLFYSDGTTVWNKLHNPMPNGTGLKGNASSSQSAMIIPKPGSNSIYYIFTVGAVVTGGGEYGFNYYTIDMNADTGLGDVVSGPFDLSEGKSNSWTEKVAAVKGAECNTFWVVSFAVNEFYAYKVSSTGVASLPKKSIVSFSATDRRGYLKISPDGSKIAVAHMSNTISNQSTPGSFLLYDFNNLTGEVTNQKNLPLIAPADRPYGAEFSSNSEKLYVNASNDFFNTNFSQYNNPANHFSTLYQFDLGSPAITDIIASRKIIDSQNLFRGGLQLGPDQKIYRALSKTYNIGMPFLGVIDNPENDGLACNYRHAAIPLNGKNSTQGLPPFIASILLPVEITDGHSTQNLNNTTAKRCLGENYTLTPINISGTSTYKWTFNGIPIGDPSISSLTLNYLNFSHQGIYKLEIINIDACGVGITYYGEVKLEVYTPPTMTRPLNIVECDDNNDGYLPIDLHSLRDAEILGTQSATVFEVLYFTKQEDADAGVNQITGLYTNSSSYSTDTLIARIQNIQNPICYETASFTVQVFESPNPPVNITNLALCDSNLTGTDTDGIEKFNLKSKEPEILNGQSAAKFTITYFRDAAYTSQIITNLTSFQNTVANLQPIYVKIVNNSNPACFVTKSFNLEVFALPVINPTFTFKQCDEDGLADGFTNFNLNEANDYLTLGDTSLSVTYHKSLPDANSGANIVPASPFSNSTQSVVYARIVNTNGCFRVAQVNLLVSSTSFDESYLKIANQCDNDGVIDGFRLFNLAENSDEIKAQFPTGQNLSVTYYRVLKDAQLEENEISQSQPYQNEKAFEQLLYVRVESDDNGECFGFGPHLKLVVEPRPDFDLAESVIYCLNLPPITVSTFNAQGNYTYEWKNESGTIVGHDSFLEISAAGDYSVMATSLAECVSFSKTIKAIPSVIATITQNDITIVDDTENNSITISTNNLGIGGYEFSLNDPYGTYQETPYFENILPGIHTIYVKDKNSCGIASIEVSVIGYPKFFTPNGDGQNDTWNISGLRSDFFQRATINVFNRFGKLITEIDINSDGWNGMLNGQHLPSTDYWFSVELVDLKGNVRVKKGHFSLIRR